MIRLRADFTVFDWAWAEPTYPQWNGRVTYPMPIYTIFGVGHLVSPHACRFRRCFRGGGE